MSDIPTKTLRIALVSFRAEFGDVSKNLENILSWIDRSASQGAQLICFPEVALQGYCTVEKVIRRLAEEKDGSSCRAIYERANRYGIVVSLGMSLREEDRIFNSQVFLGPSGFLGMQPKIHLCGNDRAYDLASEWNVIQVGQWRVGTTICYDSEFPEAARILSIKGIDILLMSFANGRRNGKNEPAQPGDWYAEYMPFIPSRAYDNRIFVIGVNHGGEVLDSQGYAVANPLGSEGVEEWAPGGTLHRWTGTAFAVDPMGQLMAATDQSNHEEKMLVIDLDPKLLSKARYPCEVKTTSGVARGDFLEVRRTEAFEEILRSGRNRG